MRSLVAAAAAADPLASGSMRLMDSGWMGLLCRVVVQLADGDAIAAWRSFSMLTQNSHFRPIATHSVSRSVSQLNACHSNEFARRDEIYIKNTRLLFLKFNS